MADRPPTHPPESSGSLWHIQQRVEVIHEEHKAHRQQHAEEHRHAASQAESERRVLDAKHAEYDKKFIIEEHERQKIDTRLNQGASKFAEMENKITPRWGMVVGAVMMVAAAIWAASKYPDEEKFEALQNQIYNMEKKQIQIETKLDAVLDVRKAAGP